jgi:hypothetical protein
MLTTEQMYRIAEHNSYGVLCCNNGGPPQLVGLMTGSKSAMRAAGCDREASVKSYKGAVELMAQMSTTHAKYVPSRPVAVFNGALVHNQVYYRLAPLPIYNRDAD